MPDSRPLPRRQTEPPPKAAEGPLRSAAFQGLREQQQVLPIAGQPVMLCVPRTAAGAFPKAAATGQAQHLRSHPPSLWRKASLRPGSCSRCGSGPSGSPGRKWSTWKDTTATEGIEPGPASGSSGRTDPKTPPQETHPSPRGTPGRPILHMATRPWTIQRCRRFIRVLVYYW